MHNVSCPFGVHFLVFYILVVGFCIIIIIFFPPLPPDALLSLEKSSPTIDLNSYSSISFLVIAFAVHLSVLFSNNVMSYTLSVTVTTLKMDQCFGSSDWQFISYLTSWMHNMPQRKYKPEEQEFPCSWHVTALENKLLVNALQYNHYTTMK